MFRQKIIKAVQGNFREEGDFLFWQNSPLVDLHINCDIWNAVCVEPHK